MGRDPSGIGHFLSPGEACETMIGPLQPSLDSKARPYTDKNSLRTDLYEQEGFGQYLADLETAGRWSLVERSEPYHPLPKGEPEVVHRVWVY